MADDNDDTPSVSWGAALLIIALVICFALFIGWQVIRMYR